MKLKRLFERFSASQLGMFSECNRKWYNTYILGQKQPPTPSQQFGIALHSVAEHYLKFGNLVMTNIDFPDGVDRDRVIEVFEAGRKHLPIPPLADVETKIDITDAAVPAVGYIDAIYKGSNDELIILDHKTAKTTRYIPSDFELSENIQMNVYGHWALNKFDVDKLTYKHVYYVNTSKPKSVTRTVTVSSEHIDKKWRIYQGIVDAMVSCSTLDEKKVRQNWSACQNYGGCPFVGQCHLNPYTERKMGEQRLIDTLLSQTQEKPKPIEKIAINPPISESKSEPPEPTSKPAVKQESTQARKTLYIKCLPSKGTAKPIHYPDLIRPHVESLCKQYDVPHVSLIGQYGDGYKKLAAMIAHVGWPEGHDSIYINPIRSKGAELILDALIACADDVIEGV